MSKSIFERVDELPKDNVTIKVLRALDIFLPGKWDNLTGFKNTIRQVTGETDADLIQQIGDRAVWLYNDKSQGYQRAMWLYETVDRTDKALGAAALANKVGEKVSWLGFLEKITPKAEKAQTIDLCVKLVVELTAFCQINGIPGDSIGDFVKSLADYSGESLMRMTALICLDALIPLGPDYLQRAASTLNGLGPKELEKNQTFSSVKDSIPGKNSASKLDFIGQSFESVQGWMRGYTADQNITVQRVTSQIEKFVELTDDKLDYAAAFLDMATNYYEHTGTQTLARRLIERAVAEI
ncbi:MAG: hypothetical protein HC838_06735 [Spirulinaceae cyanobacterium RM2_2_10]|nr:hypothetical protein [Spirulinaceae cyanobacterium SM2_1_0]NJO19816.1 hypothetical protein [Spirulinaceae cyanobacterium RM2_2_10]